MNFRADLHCHTTCSDGTLTPKEIITHAKECGLSGLSITDHDTVEAYHTAIKPAQELGIELITGVEFSSVHRTKSVHVLAYSYCFENKGINEFCERHCQRRIKRCSAILELLKKNNMPLDEGDLGNGLQKRSVGRPHIALAMVKKGYAASVEEAFKSYLREGKSCYVKGDAFSLEETLDVIHQAKGYAIIAHPHLIRESAIIQDMLRMDFDGLEGYYARFEKAQEQRWLQIAKKKDWIVTGGSDFHGSVKPHIPLGCSWVGEETFEILKRRYEETRREK